MKELIPYKGLAPYDKNLAIFQKFKQSKFFGLIVKHQISLSLFLFIVACAGITKASNSGYNESFPEVEQSAFFDVESPTETKYEAPEPIVETKTVSKPSKTKKKVNDAAPVSGTLQPELSVEQYIKKYARYAVMSQRKYGVPASISLAQGIVESRSGNSSLARENNNHFGIKCFSKTCNTGHCTNKTDDTHKDFFRKYKSPQESWEAHGLHISTGRYEHLKKHRRDYKSWAYGLKRAGYATAPNYAKILINTIEKYNLHKYDYNN